ncbi:MAG: hypothetical protein WA125_14720 [Desulfosporosinus sp.]
MQEVKFDPEILYVQFTQKLLTLSYRASIHHSLADCYFLPEELPAAKRQYRAGNLLLFDLSLWRHCPRGAGITKKSR